MIFVIKDAIAKFRNGVFSICAGDFVSIPNLYEANYWELYLLYTFIPVFQLQLLDPLKLFDVIRD